MGGHALRQTESIRLPKAEYERVVSEITQKLSKTAYKFQPIPAYFEKEDFGDLDLLFASDNFNPYDVAIMLDATEVVHNSDVTSIGYKVGDSVFQVDLIAVPSDKFDFALNYFSFNDQSNLLGRIAHRLGFKFGHLGLLYVLRDPANTSHVLREILVTDSYFKALELCGYSAEQYEVGRTGGFKTLPDIFEFVLSSPYFNKNIYLLENRNATSRVRDAKRKTYMEFLKYIQHREDLPDSSEIEKSVLREQKLKEAFELFPAFKKEFDTQMEIHLRNKAIHAKFNGVIVSELTGLTGKELGEFIQRFKKSMGNFDGVILTNSVDAITFMIKTFHESFTRNVV